jgi:hypothetical protein
VVLVLVMLAGAVLLGWLTGGSLRRLGELSLRGRFLVATAVAAQVAGALLAGPVGTPGYLAGLVVSAACAAAFCGLNLRRAGIPVAALGLALNAIVVGVNGAMPVSRDAAARAGVAAGPIAVGADPRHEIADPQTSLRPLGDVVPVPWPAKPEVISPGDGLLAAGLALFVFSGMRWRPDSWETGKDAAGGEEERARLARL